MFSARDCKKNFLIKAKKYFELGVPKMLCKGVKLNFDFFFVIGAYAKNIG